MGKIRKWFNDFINRLAKSNKEQYGNSNPDCCGEPMSKRTKKNPNNK